MTRGRGGGAFQPGVVAKKNYVPIAAERLLLIVVFVLVARDGSEVFGLERWRGATARARDVAPRLKRDIGGWGCPFWGRPPGRRLFVGVVFCPVRPHEQGGPEVHIAPGVACPVPPPCECQRLCAPGAD